ncbi:MAG: 2-isopropylmalate synthase [Spirochaetia bacterium]|nr:2-isopropylmalate synthase [Spirochaetia bacterium]
MKQEFTEKYKPFIPSISLKDRTWPDKKIVKPPVWCSVDLRDGNQALVLPMTIDEKLSFFQLLADIGFKEIEVGFPSASDTEFRFLRRLIDENLIPQDVTVQVLTQAREHLIGKTFEALMGAKRAIVHLYNSTSELQRRVVFRMDKEEIKQLAISGIQLVKSMAEKTSTEILLEYSPESFSGTETEYALEVCNSVVEAWGNRSKVILNLPATVEIYSPNIYADQIEWFCRNIKNRENVIISIHAHNDRGTAIAASEFALMAGGDRVEGTLFGNGERTGNVDIVTLALNMYAQGINPGLDFHNMDRIVSESERLTRIPVHVRHPYAGDLVYTAFSGSHQDAINKGISARKASSNIFWEVPYLPVDPEDFGRNYEAVIRINSQSGKGGVAYILENIYGYSLPKKMHAELGPLVQEVADKYNIEVLPEKIFEIFTKEYLEIDFPFHLVDFQHSGVNGKSHEIECKVEFEYRGKNNIVSGRGNGPIDACKSAVISTGLASFSIEHYSEHSLASGSDAQAVAYIQIKSGDKNYFGAGKDSNIEIASIKAMFSALNRSCKEDVK